MNTEGQSLDQKSLRYVLGKHDDADGLACDCVGFANAAGGTILLGIEDGEEHPPDGQRIEESLPDRLRKRITQITVNVGLAVSKAVGVNGGEFVELKVFRNDQSIAAMSDGRYFIRVSDETRRLLPDDLGRLMAEKNSFVWELQTTRRVAAGDYDDEKVAAFVRGVRASDRISEFVRGKSEAEILDHYLFVRSGFLTNLGILWVGQREDRAALLYAPEIQCIKYDERGRKVRKQVWNDYSLNPLELIEAVWREVPDWKESYELPDGLFRKTVPHYDEVIVRELLANALVHRPYTQRGDIFLNLHPDRLEVHNPGLLPIGVTPRNILHTSSKRNPHLAKVFYDLKLMEGEGSGFDRMYEVQVTSGRAVPQVQQGDDRVTVTVRKQIVRTAIVDFMVKADQALSLSQKELITLGVLAQHEAMTALELARVLELARTDDLKHWVGRLKELGVICSRGKTKATEYFIEPKVLRTLEFEGKTTLKGIESHRLRELVLRDLELHGTASIGQIHERIGQEIPRRKLRRELTDLVREMKIGKNGNTRAAVYDLTN